MSRRIRRGRRGSDLPAKDPPVPQDYLLATDYITGQLIRIPISALDIGDGSGDYSAGSGLTLSGTTFAVDNTVVRTSQRVIAGSGLSGGGYLSGDVTLSLDPGSGVVTIADNQTITGTKTFTGNLVMGTSAATIRRSTAVGQLFILSTTTASSGANIILYGTGGSTPNSGLLRASSQNVISWDSEEITLTPASGSVILGAGNRTIHSSVDTSYVAFSGGRSRLYGGNVVCTGPSYSGDGSTVWLRSGTSIRATANAAGFTFTSPSDRRIKADVQPMSGLERVRKLNPVSFRFNNAYRRKTGGVVDGRERYGFVAQEYREVFPDAVEESEEEFNGAKTLQMTSQDALPAAIAAIKELDAEVQALKAEVARLKGEPS